MASGGKHDASSTVTMLEEGGRLTPPKPPHDPNLLSPPVPDVYAQRAALRGSSGVSSSVSGPPVGVVAGMKIGQYELIRPLGRGGMGVVFLARDSKLGRLVAIKFLQFYHPELTRRFVVEARATARCTHENIVVVHEVGEFEGAPFMVLEFVEGRSLSQFQTGKPLPMTRVVEIMVAVVRALVRAHDEGIVHRDLKPDNVLMGNTGTIKVLDFGIAKLLENAPAGSSGPVSVRQPFAQQKAGQKSGITGTMWYMSPEQWGALPEIDHRTDIWSAGLMLYEFLSGTHPLIDRKDVAAWVMRLDDPIPSLANVAPELPVELIHVVDTCLSKRPDGRYASARDLLRALEPFLPGRYQSGQAQFDSGPYAGLRTFQEEDASRFFGRNTERAELLARLRETALMAVVGPSGVGKSSFIRAGVVPTLKSFEPWTVFSIRPGRHPMQALAEICVKLLDPTTGEHRQPGIESHMHSRLVSLPGAFGDLAREYCRREHKRLLLLVDQFEELYTLAPPVTERRAFCFCLVSAADDATSPVRVVATIRADFLGRIAEDVQFMNRLRGGLFFLGPPSTEGLRDALIQPAESAGYRFETDAMVDEMVHFLDASPNGLPLLQFAASQLWEARDPVRRLLTEQRYRGIGGVSGALVTHADRVVSRLSSDRQVLCRRAFSHLVTPERTRAVRSLRELEELVGDGSQLMPLIDELVESRLLVVQHHSDGATVEIVHESLIFTWPTLSRWLDASHEDSLFLDQLLSAAHQWDANHGASGLLWGGEMVAELQRFQRRYQGKLPLLAEAFVAAIERQAARRARLKRGLTMAGVFTVVALFAAGAIALVQINNAKSEAEKNSVLAYQAQSEAQNRLNERTQAEKDRARALEDANAALEQLKFTALMLKDANKNLEQALERAKVQTLIAIQSQSQAEANARAAEMATQAANEANAKLQLSLDAEIARVRQFEQENGSLIKELK